MTDAAGYVLLAVIGFAASTTGAYLGIASANQILKWNEDRKRAASSMRGKQHD